MAIKKVKLIQRKLQIKNNLPHNHFCKSAGVGLRFSRCPRAYNHAALFPSPESTFDKGKMKRNVNPEFVSQDMQG